VTFLLDTMVLSELRKRRRHPGVTAWLAERATSELFISVVTIREIQRGILRARTRDPGFAKDLDAWLERVVRLYADRLLPVDVGIARRWGTLRHALGHGGADLLLAATALERGLTVVTRNVKHFAPTLVATFNPFTTPSPGA
jgi:toxin FitB